MTPTKKGRRGALPGSPQTKGNNVDTLPIPSANGKPECVNLRDRFGDTYRITFDPAYDPRHVPLEKRDACMMQIPCLQGVIFPFGGDVLAVDTVRHHAAARKLAALEGVWTHQDGGWGGEMCFLFHVDLFDAVAAIVKPRKRRRLSPEQNAKLQAANSGAGAAALARWRERSIAQSVSEAVAAVETVSSG